VIRTCQYRPCDPSNRVWYALSRPCFELGVSFTVVLQSFEHVEPFRAATSVHFSICYTQLKRPLHLHIGQSASQFALINVVTPFIRLLLFFVTRSGLTHFQTAFDVLAKLSYLR